METFSPEAESAVLGSMLLRAPAANEAVELLTAEHFRQAEHQVLFRVMAELLAAGKPVDAISVLSALRAEGQEENTGGMAYLQRLTEATPYAVNVAHYAGIVRNQHTIRATHRLAEEMGQRASDADDPSEVLSWAEAELLDLAQERSGTGGDWNALLSECFEEVERRSQSPSIVTGLSTGFADLDQITSGLQPSDLVIVAGRPSMGKTSLAASIATNAATGGKSVAFFSLEMSRAQIAQSILSSEANLNAQNVRMGRLVADDWERMTEGLNRLWGKNMEVDDTSSLSILELRSKCRRIHAKAPLDLIVVDYLQLMRGSQRHDSRVQEIGEISRGLKGIAKEFSCPVLAAAQLSRATEQRQDRRPQLSDLRESGSIEADADLVIGLFRPSYYQRDEDHPGTSPEETEVIILKQRNGPTGFIRLGFIRAWKKFVNMQKEKEI